MLGKLFLSKIRKYKYNCTNQPNHNNTNYIIKKY